MEGMTALRYLFGSLLLVPAVFFSYFGILIAAKVFDDYQDSPDSTYLVVGAAALGVAATFVVSATIVLADKPLRWLTIAGAALVLAAALLASLTGVP